MSQNFNLIFTSWPIIIFATMDQEHSKETLLKSPKLYMFGPKNKGINAWVMFKWWIFTLG